MGQAATQNKYFTKVINFNGQKMTLFSLDGNTWSSRKVELTEIKERHELQRAELAGKEEEGPAVGKAAKGSEDEDEPAVDEGNDEAPILTRVAKRKDDDDDENDDDDDAPFSISENQEDDEGDESEDEESEPRTKAKAGVNVKAPRMTGKLPTRASSVTASKGKEKSKPNPVVKSQKPIKKAAAKASAAKAKKIQKKKKN